MSAATLDLFLQEISQILREKNGPKLQAYLVLEPPLPQLYTVIVNELRRFYPAVSQARLETRCLALLPADEEEDVGGSWTAFISFQVQYFAFLRDVNVEHLVETHDMLKSLLNQCILALSDASMGIVVLPTVISYSRTLARLAIGLDKRPDLVAHLTRRESTAGGEEAIERVTLVESSANVIREGFKKCLSERSGNTATGLDANGKPEGRRIGIYLCANICLKLFFHCRKLRSAEQIFGNIYAQSPPLSCFPASQRVTYLFYLGRYLFANNHFFRCQLALQAAYEQCHAQCHKQSRTILIYLTAANIILGRFPSNRLLERPEALGFREIFLPLCNSIREGNLANFRQLLDLDTETAAWFLQKRILLQIQNRCEVLVWRSLARRAFQISGFQGDMTKRAPSVDLDDLLTCVLYLESPRPVLGGISDGNSNMEVHDYVDPDLEYEVDDTAQPSTIEDIEAVVASLINQDLLHGYLSHKFARFIITGAKSKPALEIGFPKVWETLQASANKEVPGWVRDPDQASAFGGARIRNGAGMVVNLTGARPAGAPPV